ncbi:acyl-CoA thioesterase [Streptomyces cylindrosporus]|uniref:Thioesterase family protein n=1 Tax=Streptomyces cylindrosporus TaxID=2927583 RepID=A0ABS9YAX3_9ACTN|nr:acyl-CoA thioesterase domain-containing protein [Streptomyces cylindrosporus]MCI3274356.1 thioesterase family protein [Streptomyces cylindrosporus]
MPLAVSELWDDLLDCLDLRAKDEGTGLVYEARNQRLGYHRVFGGQLLAQFVRAAQLSCPDKGVKSLHALFARAGRPEEPVRYEVERHHDGGSFAALTVVARQPKGAVATASVSLHAAEDGPDHQAAPDVPGLPGPEHRTDLPPIPWETRTTADLDTALPEPPEFDVWMRTPAAEPELAPALVSYATDLTLIGTALRPVAGVTQHDSGKAFASAVTSHTVWFHRPFPADEWLLLRQHSPVLAHGRCFGRGDVLTERGSLVASYAQEALLRFTREAAS